jgi:hypothetical protein
VLCWSDSVANDWTEHYTDLSTALLRLACLQHCGEHLWTRHYTHSPEEFTAAAAEFLSAATR